MSDDQARIGHICLAIENIQSFIDGLDFDSFAVDDRTVSAVLYQLTIIGEASKALSKGFHNAHPEIPWSDIISMRNKINHEYFGVKLQTVWKTCTKDIPELKKALEGILEF